MQPTRALWRAGPDLLAADTATLAAATAMHVHLAAAPFTPGLDVSLGSLTEASFTGSAALALGTGAQPIYYDAADGLLTIYLKEPAGGLKWVCTVDPGSPETIYGVYLTDTADAVLWGTMLLDAPLTISSAGQGLEVPYLTFKFSPDSPI